MLYENVRVQEFKLRNKSAFFHSKNTERLMIGRKQEMRLVNNHMSPPLSLPRCLVPEMLKEGINTFTPAAFP